MRRPGTSPGRPLFAGQQVRYGDVFAQTVNLWIRPRVGEVQRRQAAGVGAIVDHDNVRGLMDLPAGIPIDGAALTAATLLAMSGLVASHAVAVEGRWVRRLAAPPVELVGIDKVAHRWCDVEAITLLRCHAPRLIVASPALAKRAMCDIDPQVGVAVAERGGYRTLRPAGHQAVRASWQRWAIAEAAYEQWLYWHR